MPNRLDDQLCVKMTLAKGRNGAVMDIRNSLARAALFALAQSTLAFADNAPVDVPPVYFCDGCTAEAYVAGARSLGPGRHVLFDFPAGAPRAFEVTVASALESAVVTGVAVTDAEKRRFDLSRRIWWDRAPARVGEAELEDWMRTRNVRRTAAAVLITSAYRNDLGDALETLLPFILPGAVPAQFSLICKPCPLDAVKDPPQGREISVALAAGGGVDFEVDAQGILRARAVHDESGGVHRLDDGGDIVGN